jgi:hypothetical protein
MARPAYRSLYGDLTQLKDESMLSDPAGGTTFDDALFRFLLAVSESVDDYCNRFFFPHVATKTFDGTADPQLGVPDLISVTTLLSDDDGSYETTWAATDYQLLPQNAGESTHWTFPHHAVRVRNRGTKSQFDRGQSRFQIAGTWGYREFVEISGSSLTSALTASVVTVPVTAGTDFAIGQTILVESEWMLVTDVSGNNLTVTRPLNGSTGATHADTTGVSIVRWPAPVERATLINTARIWSRSTAFEPFYVDVDLDSDVRMLLDAYRLGAA